MVGLPPATDVRRIFDNRISPTSAGPTLSGRCEPSPVKLLTRGKPSEILIEPHPLPVRGARTAAPCPLYRPARQMANAIAEQLTNLRDTASKLLSQLGVGGGRRPGRPRKPVADDGSSSVAVTRKGKKRTMSVEARENLRRPEGKVGEAEEGVRSVVCRPHCL